MVFLLIGALLVLVYTPFVFVGYKILNDYVNIN